MTSVSPSLPGTSKETAAVATAPAARQSAVDTSERSIAVLPFVNQSSDAENEYFSDGIAEEIINMLARIDGLRVAARIAELKTSGVAG